MRLDPNLSAGQRELVVQIQKTTKVYAYGFVLGIPLTFGGAHYGITEKPIGFAGTALGLVGLVVGVLSLLKARGLKEQLRGSPRTPGAPRPRICPAPARRPRRPRTSMASSSCCPWVPSAICSSRAPTGARTGTRSASAA